MPRVSRSSNECLLNIQSILLCCQTFSCHNVITVGTPSLQIRSGHPDFLDLPWDQPIDSWDERHVIAMPTGIHRHPVVFVASDTAVYAIKELPRPLALREYGVLSRLEDRTNLAAKPAGLVDREWLDPSLEQSSAVITRFVEHAFPYRNLLTGAGFGVRRSQMADAIAGLLVELHLAGCFWGDCSLSNVLCRFDAGAIETIMIDAETSEIVDAISNGRRREDIEIMRENIAGAMADIAAKHGTPVDEADFELGFEVERRYHSLWEELNHAMLIGPDEGFRVREQIARINELGFCVGDVSLEPTDGGDRVSLTVGVGGRTFHVQRLQQLTGIEAAENQARLILNDLNTVIAQSEEGIPQIAAVSEWQLGSFIPAIGWITDNWSGSDSLQGYCDFLLYRRSLASKRGHDVMNDEALNSWAQSGFPGFPAS